MRSASRRAPVRTMPSSATNRSASVGMSVLDGVAIDGTAASLPPTGSLRSPGPLGCVTCSSARKATRSRQLARRATWRELVAFLAVEDVTHAGDPADPAGTLNARDARGPSIATLSRSTLPTEALRLLALDGVLQTGARRDAERIGARAVATLRRASRSRQVIAALHRLRAPASVLPYHLHHGRGDPRVAQRRVAEEVGPLADSADATQAVVRGARWRDAAERRLFADLAARFLAA
jgi:hypothetical protein